MTKAPASTQRCHWSTLTADRGSHRQGTGGAAESLKGALLLAVVLQSASDSSAARVIRFHFWRQKFCVAKVRPWLVKMVLPLLLHGAVPFHPSDPDAHCSADARICIHVCYDTLHQWILDQDVSLPPERAPVRNLPDVIASADHRQCLKADHPPVNPPEDDKTLTTWAGVGRDLRIIADRFQSERPVAAGCSPNWITHCLFQSLLLFCGWKLHQWVSG